MLPLPPALTRTEEAEGAETEETGEDESTWSWIIGGAGAVLSVTGGPERAEDT
jgi:hypothetical protein